MRLPDRPAPLPEPRSKPAAARPSGQLAVTRRITRLLPVGDQGLIDADGSQRETFPASIAVIGRRENLSEAPASRRPAGQDRWLERNCPTTRVGRQPCTDLCSRPRKDRRLPF